MYIKRTELQAMFDSGDYFVIFTEDFSGHRIDWFKKILEECQKQMKAVIVICHDASRFLENELSIEFNTADLFICLFERGESRSFLRFFEQLDLNGTVVAIWDGDRYLLNLFLLKYKFNVLFMRPYRTTSSILGFIRYTLKISAILILKVYSNHSIGLLSIPQDRHLLLKKNWIDDEILLQIDIDAKKPRSSSGTFQILVPGYISARKNPRWIVEACEMLREQGYKDFILEFAGSIDSDQLELLQEKKCDWLIINDGYKTEEEFFRLLSQANFVLLPYDNRGSSGVVMHSLLLGNYVAITKSRGWENLAESSSGKLMLMDHSIQGIYATTKNILDLPTRNYDPLKLILGDRESVIGFLSHKG
jgi:glycosyltransferase involved in cell wall biosynthesis